ncbi:hypothetical protein HJC23_011329 [Cyclotella cryptica]|uniref:F-box domain-containing protein n=1 Tax=Cyclotella cryptica TaxID=29204 RepID=A0ABD3QZ79_9STRA|eukprot:CCRYP_001747-RA/>CCRYP_001747-RA protein AED:0.29 eAED:-0.15 QI:0/0/0/0.5/1/1/2/0/273
MQGEIALSHLPVEALSYVASFLTTPSRALLAVALHDDNSSAIVGDIWGTLDFGQLEEDLSRNLTDNHLKTVLLCVDAVSRIKTLRLANCISITGAGLEPLRGSAIIEKIDLSLVGDHESPILDVEPSLSCDFVLPILDSIIERDGNALKYLQFPHAWQKERPVDPNFCRFISRYNAMFNSQNTISCLECNTSLPEEDLYWIGPDEDAQYFGTQNYTCYRCTKHFCYAYGHVSCALMRKVSMVYDHAILIMFAAVIADCKCIKMERVIVLHAVS